MHFYLGHESLSFRAPMVGNLLTISMLVPHSCTYEHSTGFSPQLIVSTQIAALGHHSEFEDFTMEMPGNSLWKHLSKVAHYAVLKIRESNQKRLSFDLVYN